MFRISDVCNIVRYPSGQYSTKDEINHVRGISTGDWQLLLRTVPVIKAPYPYLLLSIYLSIYQIFPTGLISPFIADGGGGGGAGAGAAAAATATSTDESRLDDSQLCTVPNCAVVAWSVRSIIKPNHGALLIHFTSLADTLGKFSSGSWRRPAADPRKEAGQCQVEYIYFLASAQGTTLGTRDSRLEVIIGRQGFQSFRDVS
ncbi:hypothetical protein T310_3237 [Rasamsonia emersonii CBS 393.64]|uniref:Uncharacterized protein n=1 Tax=Rasamsonia emersonii (strain ATCC 16479 / CBS 393.64 / IMI 116815) TaxID=1408163 RepID=A0A0F4YYN6_RASE3|nr:hypothetical protein T310_3237 [Rasamsonia emersonii CBS 393.64]KKA22733.1 hypothetical protein T310_3237 [Rasamsonia emersonii CBS 393.64]